MLRRNGTRERRGAFLGSLGQLTILSVVLESLGWHALGKLILLETLGRLLAAEPVGWHALGRLPAVPARTAVATRTTMPAMATRTTRTTVSAAAARTTAFTLLKMLSAIEPSFPASVRIVPYHDVRCPHAGASRKRFGQVSPVESTLLSKPLNSLKGRIAKEASLCEMERLQMGLGFASSRAASRNATPASADLPCLSKPFDQLLL